MSSRTLCALGLLLFASACSRTDVVAIAPRHEPLPSPDGGRPACSGPSCCDATSCADASPEPTCDAASCVVDAGCDADSCRPPTRPPPPPACEALACSAVDSQSAYCALAAGTPSVQLGDGCEPAQPPKFRFAVCACEGGLVTELPLELDVLSGAATASLAVNGPLAIGADVKIAGSVYVGGRYSSRADAPPQLSGMVYEQAAPACDCEPSRLLDVAMLVSARAIDHDNALVGLDPAALDGFSDAPSLTLPCGRYYLTRIAGPQALSLEIRGRVSLFIGGNIELNQSLTLNLQAGASAEIFVAGGMTIDGRLELGGGNEGNRVLLAVGGDRNIQLNDDALVQGSLYAPRAALVTQGSLELHGALFVREASLGGATRVHFQPLGPVAADCEGP